MTSNRHTSLPGRATRGSALTKVLLIILGGMHSVFGIILVIATIAIALDGDESIFILLPFILSMLAAGVSLILLAFKVDRLEKQLGTAGSSAHAVSAQVDHPTPQPLPAEEATTPVTHHPSKPDEVVTPMEKDPTGDVAQLVSRSEDLFATLRDLVRHEHVRGTGKHRLSCMLKAAGVPDWSDAPACEGGRLSRNNHFWIRMDVEGLDDSHYDTLVSAEAALNVNQDLPDIRKLDIDDRTALDASLGLMRTMHEQVIEETGLTDEGLRLCYHHTDASATPGEWVLRSRLCTAAECLRTPFRVVYDVRANMGEGLVVIGVEIPRPRCMAIFTSDRSSQEGLARAYALRLATLLANNAFAITDQVRRVVINCHAHDDDRTLLSLDVNRQVLEALCAVVGRPDVESAFPYDSSIRAAFEGTHWFDPVEPFVGLDDPCALPAHALTLPELDQRAASEDVMRTCHATLICDLGINENAGRVAAWMDLHKRLGSTTEQAVSALVAARDATRDITVAEACTRTIQALVEGTVDLDARDDLTSLFIDGSALDRAVSRAVDLLNEEGNVDPETAIGLLEQALAPIDSVGAYLDDATTVYRYFGSVCERINHNAIIDEGGREICLVPDAYFNAHCNASIALGMLERYDEALAHADVCLRLAPTSIYATMRKVRVLESQSRIYEAADLIIDALRHAVTPRDAAICHYRLAYMEWKLGREDLAAACYTRALTWNTEVASQAREELDDLLRSIPTLERPTEEQADALLAREGIPLGCVVSDRDHTLAAAVACMDEGALLSARPLMAVLFGISGDDVVMGVYRSLNVPV